MSGIVPPAPFGVFSTLVANSPAHGQTVVSFAFEKSVRPDFYRFSSQLAVGITDTMEVGLNVPYVNNTEDVDGLEDVNVSFKHRFFDEGRFGPAIAYLALASLDTGVTGRGSEGSLGAGIVASKRVGPVVGHLNLIYSIPGDRSLGDECRASGGVEFSAANSFKILGEFLVQRSFFSEKIDKKEARFGYRFIYGQGVFSTIGVGMDLSGTTPQYRVMGSVSFIFPRVERMVEKVYEEAN